MTTSLDVVIEPVFRQDARESMLPKDQMCPACPRSLRNPLPLVLLALLFLGGCGFVPKSRLAEAEKVIHGLRAENSQLKDSSLALKSQNQDLAQRAVDDARSIRAFETTTTQYERSIEGYQEDRERMKSAYDNLVKQVRVSSIPRPSEIDDH